MHRVAGGTHRDSAKKTLPDGRGSGAVAILRENPVFVPRAEAFPVLRRGRNEFLEPRDDAIANLAVARAPGVADCLSRGRITMSKMTGSLLLAASLSIGTIAQAQRARIVQAADTPESAALKGAGAFLRGAGSYNLNTAKAESIAVDTLIRWKQDLRKIDQERRALRERQQAGKKQKIEEVKRRLA